MSVFINPSILSADFVNLESELHTIALADAIHVDVMDGHFVPNLTFGLPMVKRLAEVSVRPLDVHLMIEGVDDLAVAYADTGAKSVTFHFEASTNPVALARKIRSTGCAAAIAVKPGTPVDSVFDSIDEFDMVLIMTVEPGFGGQRFMDDMMSKVSSLRDEISTRGLSTIIQVDGGIDRENIVTAARAGANSFVAGSSIFKSENRSREIEILRNLASENFTC